MDKHVRFEDDSFSTKVYKFIKKQCILSFCSVIILFFGSLFFFDSKIDPIPINLPNAPELVGSLRINNKLANSQYIHYGKLKGCESLVLIKGYIYGSCLNGEIVKFNDTQYEVVAKLSPKKECKKLQDCGRPLGMRYDAMNNRLLFVESFSGVYELSLIDNKFKRIFPTQSNPFDVVFFDDLDILPNGDVLVTQSSTKYGLNDLMSVLFEGRPNGRLLQINTTSGQHQIIADNIFFPNGVQIHRKNANIALVVETGRMRILSIDMSPDVIPSKRVTIFADNLPGYPDNIRPSTSSNGYWVNFASIRHSKSSFFVDVVNNYPSIRIMLKKFFMDPILHMMAISKHGILLRIDEYGNIIESLHDPEGLRVTSSSETLEVGDTLYLGNYYLPFLVKVNQH